MAIEYKDPIERVDELLISQYYHSSNLQDYIKAFILPMSPIMKASSDTVEVRQIDRAYGFSLDIIGRILGASRLIAGAEVLGLFGFYDNASAEGFNIGTFFSYGDRKTGDLLLNDYMFRRYIRARIILNTSGGKIEDIIDTIDTILNRQVDVQITEGDAELNIFIKESLPAADKVIVALAIKTIKAIGVGVTLRDNNGNIKIP